MDENKPQAPSHAAHPGIRALPHQSEDRGLQVLLMATEVTSKGWSGRALRS